MQKFPPLALSGPFKISGIPDPTIDVVKGVYFFVLNPEDRISVVMPNGWIVTEQYGFAEWIYFSRNISTGEPCH
jgi:hypothetical protein